MSHDYKIVYSELQVRELSNKYPKDIIAEAIRMAAALDYYVKHNAGIRWWGNIKQDSLYIGIDCDNRRPIIHQLFLELAEIGAWRYSYSSPILDEESDRDSVHYSFKHRDDPRFKVTIYARLDQGQEYGDYMGNDAIPDKELPIGL